MKFFILLNILFFSFQLSAAEKVRVMVIDTGVDLSWNEISSHVKNPQNSIDYTDENGHGTAMASLVLKDTCPEIELISCNYYDTLKTDLVESTIDCYKRALKENIQYINYSSSGTFFSVDERDTVKQISDQGIIMTVAAGNDGINLINEKTGVCDGTYPSCFFNKNVYIVQNLDPNGHLHRTSNYVDNPNARSEMGVHVPVLAPNRTTRFVTGTSPAAAKYMNFLLRKKCQELKK